MLVFLTASSSLSNEPGAHVILSALVPTPTTTDIDIRLSAEARQKLGLAPQTSENSLIQSERGVAKACMTTVTHESGQATALQGVSQSILSQTSGSGMQMQLRIPIEGLTSI